LDRAELSRYLEARRNKKVIGFDDDLCIEDGICPEDLPQYFEIADGEVRAKRLDSEAPFRDLDSFQLVDPLGALEAPREDQSGDSFGGGARA
jgi:hypothetical protein